MAGSFLQLSDYRDEVEEVKAGPKVLICVDTLRVVARKILPDLLTNEEKEFLSTYYGESEHLYQVVLNVWHQPSYWLKPGEVSKWDRQVMKEIAQASRKNRKQVIIELPEGYYHEEQLRKAV